MSERSIFLSASEMADPGERAAYLDRACAGEPALRGRVDALLAAAERTGSFMARPAPELLPPTAHPAATADHIEPAPQGGPTRTVTPIGGADPGETRALLLRQLRRAVACLLGVGSVGLALQLWALTGLADRPEGATLRPFHYVVLAFEYAVFLAVGPVLFRRRPTSLARLRWVELAVFVSLAASLAANEFVLVRAGELGRYLAFGGEAVSQRAKGLAIGWFSLIVLYGTFIPNTARRCATVAGGMAALAVGGTAAGLAGSGFDGRVAAPALVTMGVWLGFAVLIAMYGAYRIDTHRRAAAASRLLGPYTLVRKLGAGGMGEVHLAEHRLLKRPCAVKLIHPESAAEDTAVRRFEREVQAATRLSHPAAVQVYDYGRSGDGTFYYVMEFLPGLTLDEVVARSGPLPPGRVVHVLRQVCGALAEAHALGLVHRDVKPGNVMLCRLGGRADAAKLLDFGLVSAAGPGDDRLTQAGGIMGTPAYMSPEQARGADAGPAADVYAVGAVGYFLLTGRPPFAGRNPLELLHAHLSTAVVPPSELSPAVPADLEGVLLRCLAKDPADRFAAAGALDAALAGCGCAAGWPEADAAAWWDAARPDPNHPA